MISNKYINAIIATITAIAIFFTSLFYVKSKNITIDNTTSSSNFTYLNTVFNKENITEIDIEVDEDNWNYLLENAADEEYINANITVNGTKYYNVGIRAKGNSSLSTVASDDTTDRYSFKVKFDEYIDGQTMDGLSKIALNNIISDATYMKEYLSYDLLDRMGVPTPAFAFTNITLNGEEWGLYFAVEVIEEEFIERTYGSLSGNLYKPEGNEIGGNKDNDNQNNKPNMNNENMGNPPDMSNMNNEDMATPPDMGTMNNEDMATPPDMSNTNNGDMATPPDMGTMDNGDMATPPDMGTMDNGDMTTPPDMNTMDNGDNNTAPNIDNKPTEDTSSTDNTQTNNTNNQGINGFRGGMMGGGGMGASSGGSLVYTDDNTASYSDIFDNEIFKTTTDSDEEKVIEMIKNLNEGTNLEEYLNVDEILRYFAVNTFLVNLDSYASNMKHNYYLYERDGVFEILPWDYNLSFGGFTIGSASNAINFPIDSPVTDTAGNSPLIEKLLEVDEYKETYHKYLQEIVDYVNDGTYENTINSVNSLISEYVKNDATAFYTYEEYEASIPELINFGKDRAKSIAAQLDGSQPSTSYGNIETTVNLNALGSQGGGGNKGMNMQMPTKNENIDSTTSASLNNNTTSESNGDTQSSEQLQMPDANGDTQGNERPQMPNANGDTQGNERPQMPNSNGDTQGNERPQMPNANDNTQGNEMPQMPNNSDTQNNNETQTPSVDNNTQNNNQQQTMNNNFQRPDNINDLNNSEVNIKNILLQFAVYFGVLLIAIIFVLLFKRRKFKV